MSSSLDRIGTPALPWPPEKYRSLRPLLSWNSWDASSHKIIYAILDLQPPSDTRFHTGTYFYRFKPRFIDNLHDIGPTCVSRYCRRRRRPRRRRTGQRLRYTSRRRHDVPDVTPGDAHARTDAPRPHRTSDATDGLPPWTGPVRNTPLL